MVSRACVCLAINVLDAKYTSLSSCLPFNPHGTTDRHQKNPATRGQTESQVLQQLVSTHHTKQSRLG